MINVIYNKIKGISTINITGEVGKSLFGDGITLDTVMSKIQIDSPDSITMNISTLGGDLMEALAIHDYLKALDKKKVCNIIGNTASAGTVIAMAADQVFISKNSRFLIHNTSTSTEGNADDFMQQAQHLASFDNTIADIYVQRTGMTKDAVIALMKENRWMPANEAIEKKFCDGIIDTINNQSKIKNMDEQQMAAMQAENEALKKQVAELQAKLAEFENTMENLETQQIDNEIEQAIDAGKITDNEKDVYKNFGKGNLQGLRDKLKNMESKKRVFTFTPQRDEKMDWDSLHKGNPKLLAQIKANDKKLFNQIFKEKFGTDYTEVR